MGHEINAVYTIENAGNGVTAVLNDPTDDNYVGLMTDLKGPWPSVRGGDSDRPGGDGALRGPRKNASRYWTCEGIIEAWPPTTRNERIDRLTLACDALDDDATIKWTDAAGVDKQVMYLRLESEHEVGDTIPKKFMFVMRSTDHRVFSQTLHEESATFEALSSGGVIFPIVFPVVFGAGVLTAQMTVTNAGNQPTPPIVRIDGPALNPRVYNATVDASMVIDYDIPAGEYITIDRYADYPVTLNGSGNIYRAFDEVNSEWWELAPGDNDIRLYCDSFSDGSGATVYWRDGYLS